MVGGARGGISRVRCEGDIVGGHVPQTSQPIHNTIIYWNYRQTTCTVVYGD